MHTQDPERNINIKCEGEMLEEMDDLEVIINHNKTLDHEIRSRISKATEVYCQANSMLINKRGINNYTK